MLIATAFPEAPDAGEQPPLPDGDHAHRRVNENLVGRLLAKTRNASAPGGDRMGAEILKIMWEWAQNASQPWSGHASNLATTPKPGRQPKEW